MAEPNRELRRAQERARRKLRIGPGTDAFLDVPEEDWPNVRPPAGLYRIRRNSRFFVFECHARAGATLLMVQRLDGRAGITWDELYAVKALCGFVDREAVEIYPEASRLVFSANMRHIFVLPPTQRMPFGIDASRVMDVPNG